MGAMIPPRLPDPGTARGDPYLEADPFIGVHVYLHEVQYLL